MWCENVDFVYHVNIVNKIVFTYEARNFLTKSVTNQFQKIKNKTIIKKTVLWSTVSLAEYIGSIKY